ncbi:hypothetical protein KHQ81_09875 [Mycoplasmatota bacterium]|nr:hypothetical protein KHQ81_09875 [Mycoplasmatota bacterium]
MKRLILALVMLCVFMIQMNQDFNVYAESCDGPLQVIVPQDDIRVEVNGEIPDYKAGVTVLDSCGNVVTDYILTVLDDFVDVNLIGDYQVAIYAYDGHYSGENFINIHVQEDITPPELSVAYEKFIFLQGDVLEDSDFLVNAYAYDDKDLDITENIVVDYSNIDMGTTDQYKVIFEVFDQASNKTTKEVDVVVLGALPELIINASSLTHEVYDELPDFLLGVNGYLLDDVEAEINVDYGSVNPNQVGSYEITYTASLHNLKETKTVIVNVVDSTPPEITGIPKVKIKEGLYFNPYKYLSVHDNYNAADDITVKVSGNYSTRVPGEYIITAVAMDKSGNQSEFTFELIVVEEENHTVLWTTIILGVVIVGASGALYYIRKKREY